jgi:hypothetical protein
VSQDGRTTTGKELFIPSPSIRRAEYSPDIGVFSDGKVEVMFKLTISQAQALANLLKEHKL